MIFLRALAFVALRRRGMKPAEAYDAVMRAPFVAVNDFFPDLEPELTPDDPDTDQGKDG